MNRALLLTLFGLLMTTIAGAAMVVIGSTGAFGMDRSFSTTGLIISLAGYIAMAVALIITARG